MKQYKKRTEEYDAPAFILGIEPMMEIVGQAYHVELIENKEIIKQMGLELDEEDFPQKGQEKKVKMYNSLVTKRTFEKLKNQSQFEKLNVVIYNPILEYHEMLDSMKEMFERAKDFIEQEKRIKNSEQLVKMKMGYDEHIERFIHKTKEFGEIYRNALTTLEPNEIPMDKRKHASEVVTTVKMVRNGFDIAKMSSMIYLAFTRYEIDFKQELINVYKSYCKVKGASPRDFKPFEHDLHEKLEKIMTFKDIKKEMIWRLLENQPNIEVDAYHDKQFELRKKGEDDGEEEGVEELLGHVYKIGYGVTDILAKLYLMYGMSFVLENNMIVKKVEKERVLKPNKGKKKKTGGSNYKSIVRTRYVYDVEKAQIMLEKAKEELEKMKKERKEAEYKKEEWEVKPHVRTLKDGRKVLISAQKRKRKKEIIENKKNEEKGGTRGHKTLGITNQDIEKVVLEAKNKL